MIISIAEIKNFATFCVSIVANLHRTTIALTHQSALPEQRIRAVYSHIRDIKNRPKYAKSPPV